MATPTRGCTPGPTAAGSALGADYDVKAPLISVIIPTFNVAEFIGETLRSVLGQQGVRNFEVLLVDDRSSDDTVAQAHAAARGDPRLRVLHNTGPQGAAGARNHGLQHATGTWVAFLDGDDLWEPDNLALKMRAAAQFPDEQIISSDFFNENRYNRTLTRDQWGMTRQSMVPAWSRHVGSEPPADGAVLRLTDLTARFIEDDVLGNTGTFVLRRDTVMALGGFDSDLEVGEDVYLWIKMAERVGSMLFVHKPLMYYRFRPGSLTNQGYPAHAFFAERFFAVLASKPEFAANLPLIHRRIISALSQQCYYHRSTRKFALAIAACKRGLMLDPYNRQLWTHAVASLLRH